MGSRAMLLPKERRIFFKPLLSTDVDVYANLLALLNRLGIYARIMPAHRQHKKRKYI